MAFGAGHRGRALSLGPRAQNFSAGGLIVLIPFRRGERWAWSVLWFYPVFWVVHLVAELPPGKDHIHQIGVPALRPPQDPYC